MTFQLQLWQELLMVLCSFAGIDLLAFGNEAYWKHTQMFPRTGMKKSTTKW